MGRHATVLITAAKPYRRVTEVTHRGGGTSRRVLSWADPVVWCPGATGPALGPCEDVR
jgi:hypothetical protein